MYPLYPNFSSHLTENTLHFTKNRVRLLGDSVAADYENQTQQKHIVQRVAKFRDCTLERSECLQLPLLEWNTWPLLLCTWSVKPQRLSQPKTLCLQGLRYAMIQRSLSHHAPNTSVTPSIAVCDMSGHTLLPGAQHRGLSPNNAT